MYSFLFSFTKRKMTLTAKYKNYFAIKRSFRCDYLNTTLLLNVNTFSLHRLMVFLPVMYRERLLTTTALNVGNHGLGWKAKWLVRGAIPEPRHVPQYVHDSVSNVSHLPAVNYGIQRRIKICKSPGEKINFLKRNTWAADLIYNHTNTEGQITN